MALTEEEKRKIEDEERYRSQLREGVHHEKHEKVKGVGFFSGVGKLIKWILIIVVIVIFYKSFMSGFNSSYNSSGGSNESSSSPASKPQTLVGKVTFEGSQFHIQNQDSRDWSKCKLTLNNNYNFPDGGAAYEIIKAGETLDLYPGDFTQSNGTRFNISTTKPQQIFAYCWLDKDTPASNMWTWY